MVSLITSKAAQVYTVLGVVLSRQLHATMHWPVLPAVKHEHTGRKSKL
jgi:hypothetical protein